MSDETISDNLGANTDDPSRERSTLPIVDSLLVYDEEEECPYLADQVARMPLQFPMSSISVNEAEELFSAGYRRSGKFLYHAECVQCQACEAIRLEVSRFQPTRSQRRALKKGNSTLEVSFTQPVCDEEHVRIFNRHRNERGLNRHDSDVHEQEYRMFLVDSCLDSFEISYFYEGRFAGAAICDLAQNSLSAVYTYFDPDLSHLGIGTFSIMKQIELCRERELKYLYLGYYVAGSGHMNYKKNYRPHQRLQNGTWKEFP